MPDKDKPVLEMIRQVVCATRKGRKKVIPLVQRIDPTLGGSKIRRVYQQYGFLLIVDSGELDPGVPAHIDPPW